MGGRVLFSNEIQHGAEEAPLGLPRLAVAEVHFWKHSRGCASTHTHWRSGWRVRHSALSDAPGWPSPSDSKKARKRSMRASALASALSPHRHHHPRHPNPQRLTRHTTPYCTELHSTANRAHHLPPTIRSSDRSSQPVNTLPRHPPRYPSFAALALGLPSQAACKLPPTAYGQHRCSLRCVSCSPSEPASSPGAFGSSRMKPSSSSSSSSSLPCCSPRLFRPHSPCIRPCVCRLRSALAHFHTACTRSIILQCISLSRETSCMKRPHAHHSPLSPNSSCTSPSPSLHHPFLHSFRFRLSLFGHRFHRALILTPYGRSFTTASSTSSS